MRCAIRVAAGVLLLAGCRELPRYFAGDTTIARAGGKDLRLGDVRSVVPQGLSGDDSAAFMKVYIDRWVLKQLKLQEAETLFSSSAAALAASSGEATSRVAVEGGSRDGDVGVPGCTGGGACTGATACALLGAAASVALRAGAL